MPIPIHTRSLTPPRTLEPCEFCDELLEWIASPYGVDLPDTSYDSGDSAWKARIFDKLASQACDFCDRIVAFIDIPENDRNEALSMEVIVFRSRLQSTLGLYDYCIIGEVEGESRLCLALWADAGTCRVYALSLAVSYTHL